MPSISIPTALAIAGTAASVANVGANLLGGSKASGAIESGQQQANAISQEAINETRPLYKPYIDQGTAGLTAYADFAGVNGQEAADKAMAGFKASPGYGYSVSEGLRAVDAGAAAKGILSSGATIKAEQTLGANLANQDFSAYLGRLNTLADFGTKGVGGFANVLTGQANERQSTATSAAGNEASIINNQFKGYGDAAGSLIKNGLYAYGMMPNNTTPYVDQGRWD